MYLMRTFLNPLSPSVRADVASPESLHKTVMRAFPGLDGPLARKEHAILHRLDRDAAGRLVLLIQSRSRPEPTRWRDDYVAHPDDDLDLGSSCVDNPSIREIGKERAAITVGRQFRFRLKANTTKRAVANGAGVRYAKSKRVPLRGDEARRAWLERRAEAAGFRCEPDSVQVKELPAVGGRAGKLVTVAGTIFDGVLQVVDAGRFSSALEHGVGPAKAYGFGLLSIAAAR